MLEEYELSDREVEILKLLAVGASNKEIASRLVISANTVKVHLRNIYSKLGVNSRTEAAMFALRFNLVTIEGIELKEELEPGTGLKGLISSLRQGSSRGRRIVWYMTLGLVGILLIGFIGVVIIFLFERNGVGGVPTIELESQRWKLLSDLPTARKGLAVIAYENQIYVVGGETSRNVSDFVERFDPLTNTWERLADKSIPVTDIHAVVIGGLIYIPGGRLDTGKPTNAFDVFDPRTEKWQSLPALPIPLSAYAAVAFEGRIYVFGGWDGEKFTNSTFSYDPQMAIWTELTRMDISRGYAQAEVAGGTIYVVGGVNESGPLDLNQVYFPQRENSGETPWETKASLPEPRYAFGLTTVADILHVIGGIGLSDPLPPLKYSPREDSWQTFLPPKTQPWSHLGVTNIEGFLYAVGGQHGDRISNDNFAYQAIFTISLPLVK